MAAVSAYPMLDLRLIDKNTSKVENIRPSSELQSLDIVNIHVVKKSKLIRACVNDFVLKRPLAVRISQYEAMLGRIK